jgi:hypothetical protein
MALEGASQSKAVGREIREFSRRLKWQCDHGNRAHT